MDGTTDHSPDSGPPSGTPSRRFGAVLALILMAAAACGGGIDDDRSAETSIRPTSAAPTTIRERVVEAKTSATVITRSTVAPSTSGVGPTSAEREPDEATPEDQADTTAPEASTSTSVVGDATGSSGSPWTLPDGSEVSLPELDEELADIEALGDEFTDCLDTGGALGTLSRAALGLGGGDTTDVDAAGNLLVERLGPEVAPDVDLLVLAARAESLGRHGPETTKLFDTTSRLAAAVARQCVD